MVNGALSTISKGIVHQGHLEELIKTLFKGEDIKTEARKGASITNPTTGSFLELDVWVPRLNISFEFQDAYHYVTTWDSHLAPDTVKFKDDHKNTSVQGRGDTLVLVPCWWDGSAKSLIATIRFHRPDLLRQYKKATRPISLNPSLSFFQNGNIPDIGELMLASFPATTTQFARILAVATPWWLGEKYDGIRFCWHASRKQIYTRSGAKLSVRPSYVKHLEALGCYLDGEIWFGRGSFEESQEILSYEEHHYIWPHLRMIPFDMPVPGKRKQLLVFEERYSNLLSSIPSGHSFVLPAPRILCTRRKQLTSAIHEIILDGGEGVILRKPASFYKHGRANTLVKLKATREDREALVVSDEQDGAYLLRMANGTTFKVATKQFSTHTKCKRGDVVTLSYDRYARNAIPVNPKVYRIRSDVTWEYVLQEYKKSLPKAQFLNETTRKAFGQTSKAIGYWSVEKKKKMRTFFEHLADSKQKDPLDPETWYPLQKTYIKSLKGGSTVLATYDGSYVKAIVHLFPEIQFDVTKFAYPPKHLWADLQKRRIFFETFARDHDFDPLIATNWYGVTHEQLLFRKNAGSILGHYNKNFKTALMHVFPEIGLEKKYYAVPKTHWDDENNRRNLFLEFAAEHKFDPFNANNWYPISPDAFINFKAGSLVLSTYYNGKFVRALQHLFPGMNFDESLFSFLPRKYWTYPKNRRGFFEDIAREGEFEPLIASNWYSISSDTVFSRRGAHSVMFYYKGGIIRALVDLFPEVKFDERKFKSAPRQYWHHSENRKNFFLEFAASRGFDPQQPSNWYNLNPTALKNVKGYHSLIFYYKGSLSSALVHLFPELNLEESKFQNDSSRHWLDANNRKNFLLEIAASKQFDPLLPIHWYSVSEEDILAHEDAKNALHFYNGNFVKALLLLFPDIGLEEFKFQHFPRNHWQSAANRRKFMESYAESKRFDPLVPENWYNVKLSTFITSKWAKEVLDPYKGRLKRAIVHLFPDIGIRFPRKPSS